MCVSKHFTIFFFLHFLLFFLLLHFKLYNFQMSVRIVQEQISQKEKEQSTQWLNINENRRRTCMQPATKAFFSMFFWKTCRVCVDSQTIFNVRKNSSKLYSSDIPRIIDIIRALLCCIVGWTEEEHTFINFSHEREAIEKLKFPTASSELLWITFTPLCYRDYKTN